MSLVSSSTSVVAVGEAFFLISVDWLVSGIISIFVGGVGFIFLPRRASNADPGGKDDVGARAFRSGPAEDDDDVDSSIESGDRTLVFAVFFSVFVTGSNFGFSRGTSFSIVDGYTVGDFDCVPVVSLCV